MSICHNNNVISTKCVHTLHCTGQVRVKAVLVISRLFNCQFYRRTGEVDCSFSGNSCFFRLQQVNRIVIIVVVYYVCSKYVQETSTAHRFVDSFFVSKNPFEVLKWETESMIVNTETTFFSCKTNGCTHFSKFKKRTSCLSWIFRINFALSTTIISYGNICWLFLGWWLALRSASAIDDVMRGLKSSVLNREIGMSFDCFCWTLD